ncbi:MAG TPA: hypothetical protein VFY96_10110, partial [Candidatus Binatia bacterium]|nr:hypothetical protein [Candidatus Binatia bacterium]
MNTGTPPFRADHVGSLLRPPELLRAREQRQQGSISAEGLRAFEDRAIREVAKLQEEIGLQGITDGEYRRTIWHADFCDRLKALPSRKALPTPRALRAGFNRVVRKSNAHRRAFMRRGG